MKLVHLYHPFTKLMYFSCIILFTLLLLHPLVIAINIVFASLFAYFVAKKQYLQLMKYSAFFILPMIMINPLVNHNGVTVMFKVLGKGITLEAFLYGVAITFMLLTMLIWLLIMHATIPIDAQLLLVSKLSKQIAMILSLALYLLPQLKHQFKMQLEVNQMLGLQNERQTIRARLLIIKQVFIAVVTQALDNAMLTADSMIARGFASTKRTTYTHYKWGKIDTLFSGLIIFFACIILLLFEKGTYSITFYPMLHLECSKQLFIGASIYSLFISLPIVSEWRK